MTGITLFSGNRLELLAELLATSTGSPALPPLVTETVVVQNPGIARWLTMKLAERQGICANYYFPLPNIFIREIIGRIVPGLPATSSYRREIMLWHLMALLPDLAGHPQGGPLRSYLATGDQSRRLRLAGRIVDLFDQYMIFRPEMINAWERGNSIGNDPSEPWQRQLWQRLVRRINSSSDRPDPHHSDLLRTAVEQLENNNFPVRKLPPRLALFGISSMPPAHFHLLAALARHLPVSLYLLNPCQEYWEDILSDRDSDRLRCRAAHGAPLYLERGNPLLASLGRLNRDFLTMCRNHDPEEQELFVVPEGRTLLATIQQDILQLRDRGGGSDPDDAILEIGANDNSLQIHSCHSPLREVELLHDHLLRLLADNPELNPDNILVICPELATYGPLIRAVFAAPDAPETRIPFNIAPHGLFTENRLVETFLAILELTDSRVTATEVLEIVESPPVQRRFDISAQDLTTIRRWIKSSGIRWGMDRKDRQLHGLPPFSENSWQAGLDRLLLGYAMANDSQTMFSGILPEDEINGEEAEILGRFLDCTATLFRFIRAMRQPRQAAEWSVLLLALLDDCFAVKGEAEEELQLIRNVLRELRDFTRLADYDEAIELDTLRIQLQQALTPERLGIRGLISGGVTCGGMTALRAVPFRVICILGMNDTVFPRPRQTISFDLMAGQPRPGDRSRRLDDRDLFLQTLLAAREQLYISYVGQSPLDDRCLPPSVLVSELLDVVRQGFRPAGDSNIDIITRLVTKQHLQPFHPDYFQARPGRLRTSFSRENQAAAQALISEKSEPGPLFSTPLSPPPESWRRVALESLCRFFLHPVRALLEERLLIRLDPGPETLADLEPFTITGLERYQLETDLLQDLLAGRELADIFQIKKAAGQLPVGRIGESLFEEIRIKVETLGQRLKDLRPGPARPAQEVDLAVSGFTLHGVLQGLQVNTLVRLRCARIKAKDQIRAWLDHLVHGVLQARSGEEPGNTLLLGTDGLFRLGPVDNPEAELGRLLDLYWQGMARPLPLFAESSLAFAVELFRGKTRALALARARRTWLGNEYQAGESESPYFRLCFQGRDPLDDEFMDTAQDFFQPLLEHREKIS
ncbi:MAG: exodeoxyribonuclease V subunit gamma [Desulfobacterales bacterium]|nr:exodeoxyribonuclease V subunit gamma [Desulfobacterales bacterium]